MWPNPSMSWVTTRQLKLNRAPWTTFRILHSVLAKVSSEKEQVGASNKGENCYGTDFDFLFYLTSLRSLESCCRSNGSSLSACKPYVGTSVPVLMISVEWESDAAMIIFCYLSTSASHQMASRGMRLERPSPNLLDTEISSLFPLLDFRVNLWAVNACFSLTFNVSLPGSPVLFSWDVRHSTFDGSSPSASSLSLFRSELDSSATFLNSHSWFESLKISQSPSSDSFCFFLSRVFNSNTTEVAAPEVSLLCILCFRISSSDIESE